MDRPYIVCHILSALNGKISGSFFGTEAAAMMGGEYARLRDEYHAEAWLYGTTTTKEFLGFRKPVLSEQFEAVPKGDYIAKNDAPLYYVSVDTAGEVGWESGTFRKAGRPDAHVIEVVTEQTPKAYLAYLRQHDVSYILAGDTELDCKKAVEKLYRLFGIKTLLICGGGVVNWTFVQQGVVDELSLLLTPAVDATANTPSIFEKSDLLTASSPVEFRLKDVQRLGESGLWLTYLPQR